VDTFSQPLGLRNFHVDTRQGFFLNGEPYDLHGVTRHQDRFDQGWALSAADHAEVRK
jgi:beta-galactosidase